MTERNMNGSYLLPAYMPQNSETFFHAVSCLRIKKKKKKANVIVIVNFNYLLLWSFAWLQILHLLLLIQLKFPQLKGYSDSNERQYINFLIALVFTLARPSQGVPRNENKTGDRDISWARQHRSSRREIWNIFFLGDGNFVVTAWEWKKKPFVNGLILKLKLLAGKQALPQKFHVNLFFLKKTKV